MKTFVDESGLFSGFGQPNSPSVQGALVIPHNKYESVFRQYRKLRRSLEKNEKGEVKGHLLSDNEVLRVVVLLRSTGCLYFASMFEAALHTPDDIETHKAATAEGITKHLTADHSSASRSFASSLQSALKKQPLQLYVQAMVLTDLLTSVLRDALIYYSQVAPSELGRFEWTLDAKDAVDSITPWEKWWSTILLPWVQFMSVQEAPTRYAGEDFFFMARFEMETPDYLERHLSAPIENTRSYDLRAIFKEMTFCRDPDHGLELVDILTNRLRQGIKGHSGTKAWQEIRTIMIQPNEPKGNSLNVIDLVPGRKPEAYSEYLPFLKTFFSGGVALKVDPKSARKPRRS
jgi:hypothetical protein